MAVYTLYISYPCPFYKGVGTYPLIFNLDIRYGGRRYSDSLRAGRSGNRTPVGARFSAPIQTDFEAHPASCTMGPSLSRGKGGRGVALTTHPIYCAEVHEKE